VGGIGVGILLGGFWVWVGIYLWGVYLLIRNQWGGLFGFPDFGRTYRVWPNSKTPFGALIKIFP